jgi:hypothetical protein
MQLKGGSRYWCGQYSQEHTAAHQACSAGTSICCEYNHTSTQDTAAWLCSTPSASQLLTITPSCKHRRRICTIAGVNCTIAGVNQQQSLLSALSTCKCTCMTRTYVQYKKVVVNLTHFSLLVAASAWHALLLQVSYRAVNPQPL